MCMCKFECMCTLYVHGAQPDEDGRTRNAVPAARRPPPTRTRHDVLNENLMGAFETQLRRVMPTIADTVSAHVRQVPVEVLGLAAASLSPSTKPSTARNTIFYMVCGVIWP